MNRLKRVFLIVALGLMTFTSQASATILFQDDFQSDSSTLCNDTVEDKDPVIGTDDIGGNWSVSEPDVFFVNVVNDTTPYSGVAGENKYLKLKRNDNANPKARGWVVLDDATQTLNEQIEQSFDFFLRTDGSNQSSSVNFYNSGVDTYSNNLFELNFNVDGSMDYYDAETETSYSLSTTHSPDQWNNVKISFNMVDRTFNIQVGTSSASGSWNADEHQIATVLFTPTTNANEFFIDNVKLDVVPEPGSIIIMIGGALGLLAYAWRKHR